MQDTDASTRRLTRTAAATLERTFTTRPDLRGSVADLAATWLQASPGRVSRDSAGRLRLSGEARATLGKLGRTLQWMSSPSHHKGQQAARIAAKTLRGLDCNRLTFAGLLDLAAEFQAARFGHIRANAQAIPRAPSTRIVLDAEGTVATRITSLAELRRLGRELGNCLNDSVMAPQYGRELRVGETEFWRIDVGQEARLGYSLGPPVRRGGDRRRDRAQRGGRVFEPAAPLRLRRRDPDRASSRLPRRWPRARPVPERLSQRPALVS